MDTEILALPARSGSVAEQITDEVSDTVAGLLDDVKPGQAVAVGPWADKEGTARTLGLAVRDKLAERTPPVHVRTHIVKRETPADENADRNVAANPPVKQYRAAVSKTPDGKPSGTSRKPAANGDTAATAKPAKTTTK